MTDPANRRGHMVDIQLAGRGIRDRAVLNAMRQVPRESFVDRGYEEFEAKLVSLGADVQRERASTGLA